MPNYRTTLLAAVLAATVPFGGAGATTFLYDYTGNGLARIVHPPFTTSDFISFAFTSPHLLGDNLNDAPFSQPILHWSLSVGPLHFSSANSVLFSINFSTDAAGAITFYQFTTQTNIKAPGLLPPVNPPSAFEEEVFSFDLPAIFGVQDAMYIPSIFLNSHYADNANNPGRWTIRAVPEPASAVTLLAGLGCLAPVLRRRRDRADQ